MKTTEKIRVNVSVPARIAFVVFFFALPVHIISMFSAKFADFFNRYISSVVRMALSKITMFIPFSLGETFFVCIPILVVVLLTVCFSQIKKDDISANRAIINLFAVVAFMYSIFAVSFGIAYNTSTLDVKLGLDRREVSADELYYTATVLKEKTEAELDNIDFKLSGESVMPYSVDKLNEKVNDAYKIVYGKYGFISPLTSKIKSIAFSDLLTYTHISGVYTYYTGEANLNINFPDYVLPYTTAHELAHQRGIAREEEANFVAFLVCRESDDSYIRYSGYQSVLEYVISALYEADEDLYNDFISTLDGRIRYEMVAYNQFFEKYKNSAASKVSNAVNDTYLKSQGQKSGTKSYNLVVDLAVAFYANSENN